MRRLLLTLGLALIPPGPVLADDCSSIVASVCDDQVSDVATGAKVLSVKTTLTTYVVGDRYPFETRSLLMNPARYDLQPSDGTWRYYAMEGVVYRVQNDTGVVLEVIRNHRTAHLR
jgi:hypothetical protein